MMRTTYDPVADAFYARFAPDNVGVDHTNEVAPGVMVDLDEAGNLIGVEVLGVQQRGTGAYGVSATAAAA